MLIVKRPTAIVFGWDRTGEKYEFITSIFSSSENNMQWVDIIPCDGDINWDTLNSLDKVTSPDVIVVINKEYDKIHPYFDRRILAYNEIPNDDDLANDIVTKAIDLNTDGYKPEFSVFTPAFKTGERISRTYESLTQQTLNDWEWTIVDDSPPDHDNLWERINKIAENDFRVNVYRVNPNTGGNVGLAKYRACSLSRGKWLVELDHDDYLLPECLETIKKASTEFPDAGFIYSDCTEMYENGKFIQFDHRVDWDYYGAENNHFNFGYSGHSWVEVGGKRYLQHHYPSINPLTIRFNLTMPNHVRCWRSDVYKKIGGHRGTLQLADDFDLIIRTFLEARIVHVKKLLYIQYNNGNSTVDYNSFEINRISRIIKEKYNKKIHSRIKELGFHDWEWNEELQTNYHQEAFMNNDLSDMKFWEEEQVLNYVYEE
jgi:glycosyltransferase involved in cell wall biosynthesis